MQHRIGSFAFAARCAPDDQLLDGLRTVVQSGAGRSNVVRLVSVRHQDVALIMHRGIKCHLRMLQNLGRILVIQPHQDHLNFVVMAFVRVDATVLQRVHQIGHGEFVFRIMAGGVDADAVFQRQHVSRMNFSRHRHQRERAC